MLSEICLKNVDGFMLHTSGTLLCKNRRIDLIDLFIYLFVNYSYILSPNVSIISGFDAPNVRLTLLGNDYTHNLPVINFYDWQSLRMTEIYEFCLSLNNDDSG